MKAYTIIVNDVAASGGGALSILSQFLESVQKFSENSHIRWIFFVSNSLMDHHKSERIRIVHVQVKRWSKRIVWDTVGIRLWLKKRGIKPDLAISLMSVGLKYVQSPQLVYIHQPLPFSNYKGFKWFEKKYQFYNWGIFRWMKWSIIPITEIVVQTNHMKESVSRVLGVQRNMISIYRPKASVPEKFLVPNHQRRNFSNHSYRLFYPVVPSVSYKNLDILIEASFIINKLDPVLGRKLKFTITAKSNEKSLLLRYYYRKIQELNVFDNFEWVGYLDQVELHEFYKRSDGLVFPSSVETFGLPLIEAAVHGKKIFSLNAPFVKDVLQEYEGYEPIDKSPRKWADTIIRYYNSEPQHFKPLDSQEGDWDQFIGHIERSVVIK